jgi:hypothetical protein
MAGTGLEDGAVGEAGAGIWDAVMGEAGAGAGDASTETTEGVVGAVGWGESTAAAESIWRGVMI